MESGSWLGWQLARSSLERQSTSSSRQTEFKSLLMSDMIIRTNQDADSNFIWEFCITREVSVIAIDD